MSIFILNRTRLGRDPYDKWIEDIDNEVHFLTRNDVVEDFKKLGKFDAVEGFSNFSKSELPYRYIDKHINEKNENYLVSIHEYDLIKAGKVRDRYGLEGQSAISAQAFRDKVKMKELLKDAIVVPKFKKVTSVYDILDFINEVGFPVVIKPVDMAASVDVFVVKNEQELDSVLEHGIGTNWEIEEFIDGEMYHIDGLYGSDKILLCRPSKYINGCLAYKDNKFLGSVLLTKENPLFNELKYSVKKVLDTLPTPKSTIAFHAEFFVTADNNIILCEIASRVGGVKIVEVLEHATGVNILKEWVRAQCGVNNSQEYHDNDEYGGWVLIPPQNGKLVKINKDFPYGDWVAIAEVNYDLIGKEFDGAGSSIDQIAEFAIKGKNEEEVIIRIEQINEWFRKNTIWDTSQ